MKGVPSALSNERLVQLYCKMSMKIKFKIT